MTILLKIFLAGLTLAGNADFLEPARLDGSIALDLRYATKNNFTHKKVYPSARCLLRAEVAEALARVQRKLRDRGLGLKLWDCYRPFSVQKKFWLLVPDERYVARPVERNGKPHEGSKHNRGAAVDLTLVDAKGNELEMPTAFDDFSERAHRNSKQAGARALENAKLLEGAMVAEGFVPLATEWWHFDYQGWEKYPLSDQPLE
ncbi:MAG: M15 family metallopeptidase [Deltaproteobacteria bacterium]|nr:M15 family metallopeptidase [Deltaproteobacteria bacterium]